MKVVHVSFYYDETLQSEEALLEQHYTITGWAEALQRCSIEVIAVNRFIKDCSFKKNGVQYFLLKDSLGAKPGGWRLPLKFLKKISSLDADIIHLHHLTLSLQTALLRFLLPEKTAIIIQHHGGAAPGKTRRAVHNFFNTVADGFLFTTIDQGKEWFMRKKSSRKILPVMEGATFFNYAERDTDRTFTYYDRNTARKKTGMIGDPVFLWVGRLDNNKDPLTVLEGFEILFQRYHGARLYMIFNDDKLANEVQKKISSSEILKDKVHLSGKISHHQIEMYYNSADYFVLGSHYEGSGYALSEALVCGCIPIVTNIPSFSMMTNGGQLGALWEPGNKDSFIEASTAALKKPLKDEANACIDFYKKTLSFDAIAGAAIRHYQEILKRRSEQK